MDSHSDPTENLDSILLDDSAPSRSANEDINNLISGTRLIYNYDASETFPEADLNASDSINVVISYLKDAFKPSQSINPVYASRTDDEQLAMNKSNNDSLPVTRSSTEKPSTATFALSNSVAVSTGKQRQLQLAYPLEDTYRARYKSDYFPQNGSVRRPRYIADSASNHFITLQLPVEYQHDLRNFYIRVALITKLIEGHGHYYSPYKFQKDHHDIQVPDENPTYIKVETSQEDNFTMRLQLVLIKSKLDHLNYVQPLKLFTDTATSIQNIIHEEKLSPKDLITKYQLDKSHIAFTLCTKLPDGFYKSHPDTTVISSVITEASTSRRSNESTAIRTVDSTQNVCCPHCAHRFDPDTSTESDERNEPKSTHSRPSRSRSRTNTENHSNKKKKNA